MQLPEFPLIKCPIDHFYKIEVTVLLGYIYLPTVYPNSGVAQSLLS